MGFYKALLEGTQVDEYKARKAKEAEEYAREEEARRKGRAISGYKYTTTSDGKVIKMPTSDDILRYRVGKEKYETEARRRNAMERFIDDKYESKKSELVSRVRDLDDEYTQKDMHKDLADAERERAKASRNLNNNMNYNTSTYDKDAISRHYRRHPDRLEEDRERFNISKPKH